MESKNIDRRMFLKGAVSAATYLAFTGTEISAQTANKYKLPKLKYKPNQLEPFISSKTVKLHYNDHHGKYLKNLSRLIAGTKFNNKSLEEIIRSSHNDEMVFAIFRNASLAYNHSIYWNSMSSNGGGKPYSRVLKGIENGYGSFNKFRNEFIELCSKGSHGWVWLVKEDKKIKLQRTEYMHSPLTTGKKVLANIDLWEHAYYLDYFNRPDKYVKVFIDKLINWEYVLKRFTT